MCEMISVIKTAYACDFCEKKFEGKESVFIDGMGFDGYSCFECLAKLRDEIDKMLVHRQGILTYKELTGIIAQDIES